MSHAVGGPHAQSEHFPPTREDADASLASPPEIRRRLRQSALLTALLAIGVLAALTPRYETNDDAGMNAIAAGRAFVDRPDEHLVFSNVLVGRPLKALYEFAPRVPWYGSLLFLTACLALWSICFVCLRRPDSEWTIGLTGFFLWVGGIPVLTQLQFTRIAFLAGLAGLLLLADAVRGRAGIFQQGLALALLLVSGLIRYDGLRLVCVVLFPVIVWLAWRALRERRARLPVLMLLAGVALSYAAAGFNEWYYSRDPKWHDYYAFSALRVEFNDYAHVEYNPQTARAFATVGWLPVDLQMLRSRAFWDEDRFNLRTLRTFLAAFRETGWQAPRPWLPMIGHLARDGELLGLLACGLATFGILATDRSARWIPWACYGMAILSCAYLYRNLHLPPRVYCPAFSGCAAVAIVFANGPRSFGKRRAWTDSPVGRHVALAVVAAVLLWRGAAIWRSNANFVSFHKDALQMVQQLVPKGDQLYVLWPGNFPLEYVALPFGFDALPRDLKLLDLNWTYGFSQVRAKTSGSPTSCP